MNGNEDQSHKLQNLKDSRTPFQQKLLDQFWQHSRSKGEWPLLQSVYSQYGRSEVREALSALGGNVLREEADQRGRDRMQLSLLGILLTSEAPKVEDLLQRYLEYQRLIFEQEPEKEQITHEEIAKALRLSPEDTALLGHLIFFGNLHRGSGGHGDGRWTVTPMTEAEGFSKSEDFARQVARWATRYYRAAAVVFKDEARQQELAPSYSSFDLISSRLAEPQLTGRTTVDSIRAPDLLKRRYQVFVSSTYSDLIEERKHVMQALLVTKCIPSGMELFPRRIWVNGI